MLKMPRLAESFCTGRWPILDESTLRIEYVGNWQSDIEKWPCSSRPCAA